LKRFYETSGSTGLASGLLKARNEYLDKASKAVIFVSLKRAGTDPIITGHAKETVRNF